MANTSLNTTPLIRQQIYSSYLQKTLDDLFLPEGLTKDMSEFIDGDTLNVPTLGDLVARTYDPGAVENGQQAEADALDTGRITLSITNYQGVAWYMTKKLFEDSYMKGVIPTEGMDRAMRAMKERYESDVLSAHNSVQTANNANTVNGVKHRWTGGGGTRKIEINDFAAAKYALDTANVPEEGRIAIVAAPAEYILNTAVAGQAFVNNPMFEGMVTEGFRKNMRYIRNIFGFDIYVSNRLPTVSAEGSLTEFDGTATAAVAGDVCNFFFSTADEAKPVMSAWRRRPELESWQDPKFLDTRDYYKITSRYGFATHRPQGLVNVITAPTA